MKKVIYLRFFARKNMPQPKATDNLKWCCFFWIISVMLMFFSFAFYLWDKIDWLTLAILFFPFSIYENYGYEFVQQRNFSKSFIHMVGTFWIAVFEYLLWRYIQMTTIHWSFVLVGSVLTVFLIKIYRWILEELK